MSKHNKPPKTVDEAVDLLIEELSFGDRSIIANMKEADLGILNFAIGIRVKDEFELEKGNNLLLQSCLSQLGKPSIDTDLALAFIIKRLWETVQHTPVLKIVK